MSKVIENQNLRLELDDAANLVSLKNLASGMEYAAPHGLWRLVCNSGSEDQEVEMKSENAESHAEVSGRKFRIDYRNPRGSNGEILDVRVLVEGALKDDEVHWRISVKNNMHKDNVVRECHFPLLSLSNKARKMDLYTSKNGSKVWKCLEDHRKSFRNYSGEYQGMDQLYERNIERYPSSGAAVNCFELNNGKEGLYFGCHAEGFLLNCHLIEWEKPDTITLGMIKLPFLASNNQVTYDGYVLSPHAGTWHKGAEKYRAFAETWFKFHEIPEHVRTMQGWQRIIMRSQWGDNVYPFSQMGKLCEDGMKAGIDTLLMFGWHEGGHDNDYPNYVISDSLGGKAAMKKGIEAYHERGGKVNLYSNGQLIDHDSDFYRYGNGKAIATKDMLGNEHIQHWGFSGRGMLCALFGGRTFSRACPSSREFFGILKKFIDLAAEVGADGVFFDQLGSGDQLCCDSGHGHAVPFTSIMECRGAMIEKLHACAAAKNLTIGIEHITDVTAQHVDYIHTFPGGAGAENPDYREKGEKPVVPQDFSFFRYIFPEVILSNREIRDNTDMVRKVNYMLVQNLRSDVEVYRCQRSIAEVPEYQEYLGKANAFRAKHGDWLWNAKFRSDALYSCSSKELYHAGHLCADGSLVIMATQSHLKSEDSSFKVPGFVFESADFLGSGKVNKNGSVTVAQDSVVLLHYTAKE